MLNSDSDPYNHHANKYFSDRGATIYSHENLRYARAYTEILFSNQLKIPMGDEIVTAYHSPSHQLDHIDVYLEKSNVIFMSDGYKEHWLTPPGPNGLKGLLESFDKAIALADENTIIVSGNTSTNPQRYLSNKKALLKIRQMHINFTERVGELFMQGMSAEAIARDSMIQQIMKTFEVYPKYKPWIAEYVAQIIESDFSSPLNLSNEELKNYTGRYMLNDGTEVEVILNNNRLFARSVGSFMYELTALAKEKFDFKAELGEHFITFQFSSDGKVTSLTLVLEKDSWLSKQIKSGVHEKIK